MSLMFHGMHNLKPPISNSIGRERYGCYISYHKHVDGAQPLVYPCPVDMGGRFWSQIIAGNS